MICTVFEIAAAICFFRFAAVKFIRKSGRLAGVSIAAVLLCACAAYLISLHISVPVTEVKIKALNQHGIGSNGQVYLEKYSVDGAEYPVQDAVRGNWFWMDGIYVWLDENDERLEEPVTPEITLKVPVGFSRKIIFLQNEWKGLAEVDDGTGPRTFDTAAVASAPVKAEPAKTLLWILERCLVFTTVLSVSGAFLLWLIVMLSKKLSGPREAPAGNSPESLPVKVNGRLVWIELLRLVGCAGIIMLHTAGSYFHGLDPRGAAWNVDSLLHGVARYGVPIFLMITGVLYFSSDKPVSIKNIWGSKIPNFLIHYIFWALCYACLVTALTHVEGTPSELAKAILIRAIKTPEDILWYLLALIEILILIPVLKSALRSENGKRICEYILAVWFVFAVVKRTINFCWFLPHLDYIMLLYNKIFPNSFSSWIGFCILGYYLYAYGPPWKDTEANRKRLSVLGIISIIGGVVLTAVYSNRSGAVHESFYDNFTLVQIIWSVAVFVLFSQTVSKYSFSENAGYVITRLSSLTFGVYLMHQCWNKVLKTLPPFNMVLFMEDPLGNIVLRCCLTTVLTFASVYILRKIPLVRKYIV